MLSDFKGLLKITHVTFQITALNELVSCSFWILYQHCLEHSYKGQKFASRQEFSSGITDDDNNI